MILWKQNYAEGKRIRPSRTTKIRFDELPQRAAPKYNTPRDREKYIKTVEQTCRKSSPYKNYMTFLKQNLDMNRCTVLKNIKNEPGKHYRIEIHHEPFTLFDIVETVINKRLDHEESIELLSVVDEVMGLHYDGVIGLIPLTVTTHELVHSGRIFIPLQFIYQDYRRFFQEYEPYFNAVTLDKLEAKANLSLQTENIVSDALDVELVYVDVDGFQFPEIPDEWKTALGNPIVADGEKNEDYVGDPIPE